MKSQDEKLESLLWAGDPARSVSERQVSTSERAAFLARLNHSSRTVPRRPWVPLTALVAASVLGVVVWPRAEKAPQPPSRVALVDRPPLPTLVHTPTPLPVDPAPKKHVTRVQERETPPKAEPEPVVTRVVIEADSTCATEQPIEHITITGDSNSVVVITESLEVSL